MIEKIFEKYKDDILTLFKNHYRKLSAKNLNVQFRDVLKATFEEVGISNAEDEDVFFLNEWFEQIHSLNFLCEFLQDDSINEIIFHCNHNVQLLFPEGRISKKIDGLLEEDYQLSLEILALRNNISWNYADPFASFSMKLAGSDFRVTLIHYSTSANKISKAFFRSIKAESPDLKLFDLNKNEEDIIREFIQEKKNILISGSTGSGKTTFLRALLKETGAQEHVVILEDTHEILPTNLNQTSMLSQNDRQKKTLKDYCAYALRMSPDRLIVGEMRSTEVVPFLLAMNTGHKGLMSTIHANSCVDAISRIALLFSLYSENKEINFSLITKLACKNIDYVIHMEKRKIKEIARIIGSEQENIFYETVLMRN